MKQTECTNQAPAQTLQQTEVKKQFSSFATFFSCFSCCRCSTLSLFSIIFISLPLSFHGSFFSVTLIFHVDLVGLCCVPVAFTVVGCLMVLLCLLVFRLVRKRYVSRVDVQDAFGSTEANVHITIQ